MSSNQYANRWMKDLMLIDYFIAFLFSLYTCDFNVNKEFRSRFTLNAEPLKIQVLWFLLKLTLLKCHQAWTMTLTNTRLTMKSKLHLVKTLKELLQHYPPASHHYWPTVVLRSTEVNRFLRLRAGVTLLTSYNDRVSLIEIRRCNPINCLQGSWFQIPNCGMLQKILGLPLLTHLKTGKSVMPIIMFWKLDTLFALLPSEIDAFLYGCFTDARYLFVAAIHGRFFLPR